MSPLRVVASCGDSCTVIILHSGVYVNDTSTGPSSVSNSACCHAARMAFSSSVVALGVKTCPFLLCLGLALALGLRSIFSVIFFTVFPCICVCAV